MDLKFYEELFIRLDELTPMRVVLRWFAVIHRAENTEDFRREVEEYCTERRSILCELSVAQSDAKLTSINARIDALLALEFYHRERFGLAKVNNQGYVLLGPGRAAHARAIGRGELKQLASRATPDKRACRKLMYRADACLRMIRRALGGNLEEVLVDAAWKLQDFVNRTQQLTIAP